ncbi:MAG: hypothetical protein HYT37_02140 [Candidatus Sungbacteria bacterium]|nr:hypothetical protein [Candidatus Sungbacteria bacterium]
MLPEPFLKFKYSMEHYTAGAYVVRCFDDREQFRKGFDDVMHTLDLEHYDGPVSLAGGAKVLAKPEHEHIADFFSGEIAKSEKLHHTKRVILFSHHDCGACGGFAAFDNDYEKEFEFHKEELHRKARESILQKFPNMHIDCFFIGHNGAHKFSF